MLKSSSAELRWPVVIDHRHAEVVATLTQLESTQWLPAARLHELQAVQLAARLVHAQTHSPHYAAYLAGVDLRPAQAFTALASLQVLTRIQLQAPDAGLFCAVDAAHGAVVALKSSGSTGEPVVIRCTMAAQTLRKAFTLRNFAWQRLDARKTYASIRSGLVGVTEDEPRHASNWNASLGALFHNGPSWSYPITAPIERQLEVLAGARAHYLASYPSNLRGLLEASRRNPGGLEVVISQGEPLPPALAEALSFAWGVRVVDEYSSEELGAIATQCELGRFHCMAEGLVVEVLRDDGLPCAPGERGRVVVTDLRNFATALLRYATGDYAEAGEPCDCGRGLPTLGRIVGRERNLACLPDGRRYWPDLSPLQDTAARARLHQFQLLQLAPARARLRLWPTRALDASDRAVLTAQVQHVLGAAFTVEFELFDGPLPRGSGGKFLEFQCLVPPAERARGA